MTFFAHRLVGPLASLAAVAFLGLWLLNAIELRSVRKEHARLQALYDRQGRDLAQCQTNGKTLEASVARQNAALAKVRADGLARAAEGLEAVERAQTTTQVAQRTVAALLTAKPPSADLCAAADALIKRSVGA